MGAGAVAAAGLITLMKTIPTIVAALKAGASDLRKGAAAAAGTSRTERDLDIKYALIGTGILLLMVVGMLTIMPIPGAQTSLIANIAAAVFIVVFGFLFVTVSSRIAGLIGTSSNPISGMAIATMMATCVMFLLAGWTGDAFKALVISIGGVVCIASANAGNTSQDLKTGYIVGATPYRQQLALMVGVLVSVFAIGLTLKAMNRGLEQIRQVPPIAVNMQSLPDGVRQLEDKDFFNRPTIRIQNDKKETIGNEDPKKFQLLTALGSNKIPNGQYLYNAQSGNIEYQWIQGIGSDQAPAPQANLMATVVNGIIDHKLPWNLVLIGVFIVIAIELLGIRSLSFAVGFYLSIATTLAIFCGGIVRWLVDRAAEKSGEHVTDSESDVSPGSLYASGLIAAGGVVGLLGIVIKLAEKQGIIPEGKLILGKYFPFIGHSNIVSVIMFGLIAYSAYYFARKPIDTGKN
jgi:uncharacterized oligopeptide transporter (OPT) family protein